PLAADAHEADLPQDEAECQTDHTPFLGAVEIGGRGVAGAPQGGDTEPAQGGDGKLGGDDEEVGGVVQRRCVDGAPADGGVGEGGIHAQHVFDEGEVAAVVGDVAEGDQ